MTGYVYILGPCFVCGTRFSFHPHRVPSIPIDPVTKLPPDLGGDPERASREPICSTCIALINERRKAAGMEEFPVYPDAYEPVLESEFVLGE